MRFKDDVFSSECWLSKGYDECGDLYQHGRAVHLHVQPYNTYYILFIGEKSVFTIMNYLSTKLHESTINTAAEQVLCLPHTIHLQYGDKNI